MTQRCFHGKRRKCKTSKAQKRPKDRLFSIKTTFQKVSRSVIVKIIQNSEQKQTHVLFLISLFNFKKFHSYKYFSLVPTSMTQNRLEEQKESGNKYFLLQSKGVINKTRRSYAEIILNPSFGTHQVSALASNSNFGSSHLCR